MSRVRIIIVDDHEIIREGIKRILNDEADMMVVGEAEDGNDVLIQISEKEADILLLDLNIPGRKGVDLIKKIKRKKPKLQILIMSITPENKNTISLLRAGASGYISKQSALDELVNAVRKISSDGKYLSASLVEELAYETFADSNKVVNNFSYLETNIIQLIAKGKDSREIASDLELNYNLVKNFRKKILTKLNVKNDVQLTHYVLNNHLFELK